MLIDSGLDIANELRDVGCGWVLDEPRVAAAATALKEFVHGSSLHIQEMGIRGSLWAQEQCSMGHFEATIKARVELALQHSASRGRR